MKKNYIVKFYASLLYLVFFILLSSQSRATIFPFTLTYSGANENPPNASTATGTISGAYDDFTKRIYWTVSFSGLSANATGAHFHAPATTTSNAPVIIPFTGFPAATSGTYSNSALVNPTQETQLFAGQWYANIHSSVYPGGELRVQVILGTPTSSLYSFNNTYSGTQEVPPNSSTATGTVMGVYNASTNQLFYYAQYSGLSASPTGAHFHGPAAPGTNAPVIVAFPAPVSSTYAGAATITETHDGQLLSNLWYANIHTSNFPGGEIRAQITPQLPPTLTCPANIVARNDAGLCSASLSFSASATGMPAPTVVYRIGTAVITSPHVFPVGTTTVTATASNAAGTASCSFTVTVNDQEAPSINNLNASPNSLWPPNHQMKEVAVNYTSTDNCPGPITCSLSITSNEAANGQGDGNTPHDWVVTDNHHVQLRAERAGGGNDRIYTISTTCMDQYGNTRVSTTTVTVPHDMGKKGIHNSNTAQEKMKLNVLNNPTNNAFTLVIDSKNNSDKILVRVMDLNGRPFESKTYAQGSQTIKIGANLKPGLYVAEVIQGKERMQLRLIKTK